MECEEDFEEEDVVIEGSDLYNVLKEIGRTDFELMTVDRIEFPDNWEEIGDVKAEKPISKYQKCLNICQTIKRFFYSSEERKRRKTNATKELDAILQLEPLLDDHYAFIQKILEESSSETKSWLLKTLTTSVILSPVFFCKNFKIPSLILASSLTASFLYQKYHKSRSLHRLKTLVSTQNSLFHLQKRALKILRTGYGIRLDSNKAPRKFNELEAKRLKFLQPICETLVKSVQDCSKVCNETSSVLEEIISSSEEENDSFSTKLSSKYYDSSKGFDDSDDFLDVGDFITRFGDDSFKIHGEVTHKNINQLFYVFILVQSDMMLLLALNYSRSAKIHKTDQKLTKIVEKVQNLVKTHAEKLDSIINQYQSCKTEVIQRRNRRIDTSKYQDLYLHVDLLSRKLQSAYGGVSSILEEIENFSENKRNEDLLESLISNMNEVYKQIDTARNFAEFNILLINKFRNSSENPQISQENLKNQLNCSDKSMENEGNLPIVFDADPQIIDECFEEYIKEEYLKPLCEDDDVTLERAKMDRLLEKNFMSELKGVLMDKYRSMTDREARALLRYRKSNSEGNAEENPDTNVISPLNPPPPPSTRNSLLISHKNDDNDSKIPPPPPMLIDNRNENQLSIKNSSASINNKEDDDFDSNEEKMKLKMKLPVPLPRALNRPTILDETQGTDEKEEIIEPAERFSLKMGIGAKIPGFTFEEETFIGSGENSEEELVESGSEEDEILS